MAAPPPWRRPLDRAAADRALAQVDPRLRMAAPGDARAVVGLLREWARHGWDAEPAGMADNLVSWLADPHPGFALVACLRGRVAAVAIVQRAFAPPEGVVQLVLDDLYVARSSRRMGMGRALVRGLLAVAPLLDARHVSLTVRRDNHAARALYAACGLAPSSDLFYAATWDGGAFALEDSGTLR